MITNTLEDLAGLRDMFMGFSSEHIQGSSIDSVNEAKSILMVSRVIETLIDDKLAELEIYVDRAA